MFELVENMFKLLRMLNLSIDQYFELNLVESHSSCLKCRSEQILFKNMISEGKREIFRPEGPRILLSNEVNIVPLIVLALSNSIVLSCLVISDSSQPQGL